MTYERRLFFHRAQGPTESFDHFLTDLRSLSKACEFGAITESLIKDRIVDGVGDEALRERLLRIEDLTLHRAVDACRATEVSKAQVKVPVVEPHLDAIGSRKGTRSVQSTPSDQHRSPSQRRPPPRGRQGGRQCQKCGRQHAFGRCPAFCKECFNCHRHHFATCCTTRAVDVVDAAEDVEEGALFIGAVENVWSSTTASHAHLKIGTKVVKCKLDTGAEANVLPLNVYRKVGGGEKLQATNTKLATYSGETSGSRKVCLTMPESD